MNTHHPATDRLLHLGYLFLCISVFWFCMPLFVDIQGDNRFGLFIGNFGLTLIYFILLWVHDRLKRGRDGLKTFFVFLILFLISAYSLNREMNLFEDSVNWFTGLEILLCINYLAFTFFEQMPRWLQQVMCFLLGIALITFLYLAVYLIPWYAMSVLGAAVLGISMHTFVPVLFCIYTIVLIRKKAAVNRRYLYSFAAGSAVVLTICIVYTIQWNTITNTINETYKQAQLEHKNKLPAWIAVAQKLTPGSLTEKVVKADLVYTTSGRFDEDLFWRTPSMNFDERAKHDPLIVTATLFAGNTNLDATDRIRILKPIFNNSRHKAQERLWSGNDLVTDEVKTSVKIWPQFGLSYTEKLITVSNTANKSSWNDQQEAIYTFYLPEGTVVTALSLWIGGEEAKGILTTKEKASKAYKTIVGVESRDPSIVHWQEGNTVSVRVFPVMAGGSRLFKLGFTSPLTAKTDKLLYENVYFDGPSVAKAKEEISVEFEKTPAGFIVPASFSIESGTTYKTKGAYTANWQLEMNKEPLSDHAFSFNDRSYRVRPYQKQRGTAEFHSVYLDLNTSWTRDEVRKVVNLFPDKKVYVYDGAIKQLQPDRMQIAYNLLEDSWFSLFPLHEIADPANSLLVTKSEQPSPNLDDLQDTRFMENLQSYLQQNRKIKLFNIGNQLSPYLKSLKEFRVFEYENGSINDLKELASKKIFARDIENEQRIVIDNAGIAITQEETGIGSAAPDHLLRLFAYNHIMKKLGSSALTGSYSPEEIVTEATEAYVVSPVSSLVVLETQRDYDRFDIKESTNSLKNASMSSRGAVPEPHEWALIILSAFVLLYLRFQSRIKFIRTR